MNVEQPIRTATVAITAAFVASMLLLLRQTFVAVYDEVESINGALSSTISPTTLGNEALFLVIVCLFLLLVSWLAYQVAKPERPFHWHQNGPGQPNFKCYRNDEDEARQ